MSFMAKNIGRECVEITIDNFSVILPMVIFKEKEFFVAMIISSNQHDGFDPHNNIPDKEFFEIIDTSDEGWSDIKRIPNDTVKRQGHGFLNALKNLKPIYHNKNIPITWLIDGNVASIANSYIKEWHLKYFDDYGIMPASFFMHNDVNYNVILAVFR